MLIPYWISAWRPERSFFGIDALRSLGAALIALGAVGLLDSFARFAVQGLGTPAPVAPTAKLVITGLYRFVRNPMYISVVSTILGQALLFANGALIIYGGVVWLTMHLVVINYEEPTLAKTNGQEYEAYRTSVPRWIPRLPTGQPPYPV